MTPNRPTAPAPSADERELLLRFAHWQREQVIATAEHLTEQQLRWTPDDRLLPIIGIINHLTKMEWRWIEGRYGQQPFPPRTDEFHVDAATPSSELIDAYRRQAAHTEELVRDAPDLDLPCLGDEGARGPAHVVLGFDSPVTLRWVVLHIIEETAHHAGHADSTREMLDGKKMRP